MSESQVSQRHVNQHHVNQRRVRLTLNPNALSHNLNRVREFAFNSQIMAVIKANAYGHGVLAAAKQLDAADMFAVAMPEEAFFLRAAGCKKPLLVLHGFSNLQQLEKFSALNISTVVHQHKQLDQLLNSKLSAPIDVWLKVDTGMHRLGISVEDVDAYFAQLNTSSSINEIYMMSHFANADNVDNLLNKSQLELFSKVNNSFKTRCSMANSAAIMRLPKSHFDVVRPGIMLYGSSPFSDVSVANLDLQAVMQFESELISIKQINAGEAIGYGNTYVTNKNLTMGIVAAGYGDGYPRHAKNGTPVWLNGHSCSLLGRVSMDSICIDLTGFAASIGDRVVLWGNELSVDEVAMASDSISYELLCNAGAAYFSK
ncbi:Alanine racemase [hydrothermal vent metagenome]|uniref:Alanine racemase n=1 Tax=hydrothermal vent metagenome TaxID=652676 RepID=A0A3B0WCJ3_9ZZZZ